MKYKKGDIIRLEKNVGFMPVGSYAVILGRKVSPTFRFYILKAFYSKSDPKPLEKWFTTTEINNMFSKVSEREMLEDLKSKPITLDTARFLTSYKELD